MSKFNPPRVFHENIDNKRMLVQLVTEFKIKPSIAAYSLLATDLKSCDAAVDHCLGAEELMGPSGGNGKSVTRKVMKHPFIGCFVDEGLGSCTSVLGEAADKIEEEVVRDLEANNQRIAGGAKQEVCYICSRVKSMHYETDNENDAELDHV